jgi:hypothetical protein
LVTRALLSRYFAWYAVSIWAEDAGSAVAEESFCEVRIVDSVVGKP